MVKLLVWCAGDVAGYRLIKYRVESQVVETFLSPAALHEVFNFDKFLVLIPEILFTQNHEHSYITLLKAKAGYIENNTKYELYDFKEDKKLTIEFKDQEKYLKIENFINKLCNSNESILVKIPHPGKAKALKLVNKSPGIFSIEKDEVYGSGNFSTLVNIMYYYLEDSIRKWNVSELHVDLTHGTNIMIQALQLATLLIKHVYSNVNVKMWSAPMISDETVVQDISDVVDVVSNVITSTKLIHFFDERLIPKELIERYGEVLGEELGRVYGDVRSLVSKEFPKLLWLLRSGQIVLLPTYLLDFKRRLNNVKESVNRLVRDYIEYYVDRNISKEYWGKIKDTAWLPLTSSIVELMDNMLKEFEGKDPLETVLKAFDRLFENGYYLECLLIARELIVFLLLVALGSKIITIKSEDWIKIESILLQKKDSKEKVEDLINKYPRFKQLNRNILEKVTKGFDTLVNRRNQLAHGMLSEGTKFDLRSIGKWTSQKLLGRDEYLKKDVEQFKEILWDLHNEIVRIRKKAFDELRKLLTEEDLRRIEESYREFRERFKFRSFEYS